MPETKASQAAAAMAGASSIVMFCYCWAALCPKTPPSARELLDLDQVQEDSGVTPSEAAYVILESVLRPMTPSLAIQPQADHLLIMQVAPPMAVAFLTKAAWLQSPT